MIVHVTAVEPMAFPETACGVKVHSETTRARKRSPRPVKLLISEEKNLPGVRDVSR